MTEIWLYAIGSVLIVSVISLVGVFALSIKEKGLRKILYMLVSFAAGALLGDAFLHILPEVFEEFGFDTSIAVAILVGITFFFLTEKIIHWRHCHHVEDESHVHPFAIMNLAGDAIHNIIDGIIIGASYMVSIPVGIATTVAVILHEIPQEVSDFGVLLHGGFGRRKALIMNFLIAFGAVLGVVLALLLATYIENINRYLLPFAAGGFIYIAGADLIPELQREKRLRKSIVQFIFFVLGMLVMAALLLLE